MTKRNILNRLRYLFWFSDMEMTRMGLAWGALLWGLLLLWPGELFTSARTTYTLMAQIAPEELWGLAFILQGVIMTYSLLWGYRSKLAFVVDAGLGCVLWSASTVACFLAHYHSSFLAYQPPAAMSYELVGMFMSWWHLVRYSTEKRLG